MCHLLQGRPHHPLDTKTHIPQGAVRGSSTLRMTDFGATEAHVIALMPTSYRKRASYATAAAQLWKSLTTSVPLRPQWQMHLRECDRDPYAVACTAFVAAPVHSFNTDAVSAKPSYQES